MLSSGTVSPVVTALEAVTIARRAAAMIMSDNAGSNNEAERLKVQVADLTRRLKNAQLTIEAERIIAKNATAQADLYRQQIGYMSHMLRLETAKSFNIETRSTQQQEARRYEELKEKCAELHQKVRVEEVDHWMTKNKKEPLKLQRMREKLAKMEAEIDSQQKLLQEMTEMEQLNERLSTAAQLGDLSECNRLLKAGAWVNSVDAAGYLPIHYACSGGFYDVVKLFLEYGADHSSFLTGHSPLVVAANNGRIDIISLLISFGASLEDKGGARCPATIAAMLNGHLETLAYLLNEANADLDAFDANENTALHLAVRLPDKERSIQVILYLLEKGADTTKLNRKGHTALQVALYDENKPAAHALGGNFAPEITPAPDGLDDTALTNRRSMKGSETPQKKATSPGPRNTRATNDGSKGVTEEVQYLPRNIDSPVRPSPSALLTSTSSAKLGVRGPSPQAGLNRSSAVSTDVVRSRRAAALDGLAAQLSTQRPKGLLHERQGGTPQGSGAAAARGVGQPVRHKEPPGTPGNTAAVTVIPSKALKQEQAAPPAELHTAEALETASQLSADSREQFDLEGAAAAGMLDSQSVISAVTFGTAKFENP
jgi:hypothetical protein